jgi:amino acid adenylation domain-containing protein
MSNPQLELERLDRDAKRKLLVRLLRERAIAADESFPLSLGQEDLWFLHELAPESAAYSIPFCVRFKTKVAPERLEHSLRALLQRYPILRCTFHSDARGPRQRVGPLPERCLELVDASGWGEEELNRQVNACYRRPFDLSLGPVVRSTLFTSQEKGDVLLFSAHHIVFDARSLGVLLSDLAALYDGADPGELPTKSASYAEFVKWQWRMIESPQGQDAWNYWLSRLQDLLTPVSLPTDHPRPKALAFRGAAHHFEIPANVGLQLRRLAQAENATPFALLAAAFHALMHRYTGAPEIPIGTPLAGRSQPEFESAVGYFVNPIILSAPISADTTFRQHLAAMRESIIGAQEHGDFPFIELVRRLRPERDTSRTPLFQVMLNLIKAAQIGVAGDMLHTPGTDLRLGSLEFVAFPLDQHEAQFDLDLTLLDTGSGMPASLSYNVDLFDAETAARIAEHFLTLLSAAIENPDRRIADLPLLTPEEQTGILVDWNATETVYPETTIHRLIEEEVRRSPEATALVFEAHSMSYSDLNYRANQLANYLRQLGIGPDTLVAVCIERSFEMVIALLGILKSGGAYVPVDPGYPAERQEYMIRDADASVILTQAKFAARFSNVTGHVLVLDERWNQLATQPGEDLGDIVQPGDLAYSIYTSGSTGQPKGAMNTHRAVCNRLLWMQDQYKLTDADCVVQKTPFSFDVSVWEFFWPLMTGARLVLARPEGHKDPAYLVRLIQEMGVTTMHFVPSMLRVFLEAEGLGECTSLRRVICSGEALPYELQERFFELLPAELHNLYGPTEAAVDVTYWACRRSDERKIVPIGRPVANTQVYVLDGNMHPVPVGVPGELFIGGVQVGRGYWRRPALTDERFIPDPFRAGDRLYRTGDLVRWLPDGVLDYLGRTDQQVKVRGFRIELGEIESVIAEDPRIKQVAVIAREDVPGDQRLVAYISVRDGDHLQIRDLRAQLSKRLPEYMVPSDFQQLDVFPLTPNGKADRKALLALESVCPAAAPDHQPQPPRTDVESAIVAMWEEVLRIPRVGANDNFFELGGHSLLAAGVMSRVRERYNIALPLRTIFEAPTLAAFASRIDTMLWASRKVESVRDSSQAREEIEL